MDDRSNQNYSMFPFHSSLPIGSAVSPYMSIDPNVLNKESEYIMPMGASARRGRFELAFGHIGGSVMAGAALGGASGFLSSLKDRDVMQNPWIIRRTQMLNYIVKNSQSAATAFGSVAVIYSALGVLLGFARPADDELNTVAAATLTGLLYRSPAGMRRCLIGGGVGLFLSLAYCFYTSGDKIKKLIRST